MLLASLIYWSLHGKLWFIFTGPCSGHSEPSCRDSSSDIQCLASAALWNFGANLPDALSVTSFMPVKLASYPPSFQELLPVRNIKCLLGSKLSPTVCWPYRNTSLGSRLQEQGIPSADFSIQALFFQVSLHFYKLKPFIGAGGQCRAFPVPWGQSRVFLS